MFWGLLCKSLRNSYCWVIFLSLVKFFHQPFLFSFKQRHSVLELPIRICYYPLYEAIISFCHQSDALFPVQIHTVFPVHRMFSCMFYHAQCDIKLSYVLGISNLFCTCISQFQVFFFSHLHREHHVEYRVSGHIPSLSGLFNQHFKWVFLIIECLEALFLHL